MELTVFERANLLGILPREGNFLTLKKLRLLKEKLALTDEEQKKWQPKISEEGKMFWRISDDKGNPIPQEAEIEIGELETEIIRETLKRLNEHNKLKEDHLSLYEKFMGD
jgi:hypothetical protein